MTLAAGPMAFSTRNPYQQASSRPAHPVPRLYRLVDQEGSPHPVLDDLYDSLDAAWTEAIDWWREHVGPQSGPINIGVEVSTSSGTWRTLRHPGS